jgi:hypothetical protein
MASWILPGVGLRYSTAREDGAVTAIGSAFIPTFGTSKSVTRKIEMPR